jgi:hypothetical protein
MKIFSEKIPDLRTLYVRELRLLLSAEEMIAIKTQFLADSATDHGLPPTSLSANSPSGLTQAR